MTVYAPNYEHDIFVCYCSLDDAPDPESGQDQVSHWIKKLEKQISNKLDGFDSYSLTIKDNLTGPNEQIQKVIESIKRSATIIVVLTKNYVASDWCISTNHTFLELLNQRIQTRLPLFIIEYEYVADSERPDVLRNLNSYRFWRKEKREEKINTLDGISYTPEIMDSRCKNSSMIDLVYDIVRTLKRQKHRHLDMLQKPSDEIIVEPADAIGNSKMLKNKIETSKEENKRKYDVFLSYNSKDLKEVKEIAECLTEMGILPWLDLWDLPPGRSWMEIIDSQIRDQNMKAAAVFIGKDGIGPWQSKEIQTCLQKFVQVERPVIPVLLPNASNKPDLPFFLGNLHYVNFQRRDPNPLNQLLWGITGEKKIKNIPTVFLAEVTDDLDRKRNGLRRYLNQSGLRVLPDGCYPREPAAFEMVLKRDLSKCKLFVQLLSEHPGKQYQDMPKGMVRYQYEQAINCGIKVIQWCSNELDPLSVTELDHRSIIESEYVHTTSIEDFKQEVKKQAQKCTRYPLKEIGDKFVFVDSYMDDRPIANKIFDIFKKQKIGYKRLDETDPRKELEHSLMDGWSILIVFGDSPSSWVNSRLTVYLQTLSYKKFDKCRIGICLGKSRSKRSEVAWYLPDKMQIIDCRSGVSEEAIGSFLEWIKVKEQTNE